MDDGAVERGDQGRRWRRSIAATRGENPYKVQADLQDTMQALVGIVRTRERDAGGARRASQQFKERAARVGVDGHREYHAGWHTALDLRNLLTVSEAIARSAIERKESRGGHFREDYPDKVAEFSTFNIMVEAGSRRRHAGRRACRSRRCPTN